jgi:hypothetical protein
MYLLDDGLMNARHSLNLVTRFITASKRPTDFGIHRSCIALSLPLQRLIKEEMRSLHWPCLTKQLNHIAGTLINPCFHFSRFPFLSRQAHVLAPALSLQLLKKGVKRVCTEHAPHLFAAKRLDHIVGTRMSMSFAFSCSLIEQQVCRFLCIESNNKMFLPSNMIMLMAECKSIAMAESTQDIFKLLVLVVRRDSKEINGNAAEQKPETNSPSGGLCLHP